MDIKMQPSEILERAAEVLDERGWCQGGYTNDTGNVCLLGSLRVAMDLPLGELPYYSEARTVTQMIAEAIREKLREQGVTRVHPAAWNDIVAQSKEEVQDILISVAKDFRNEGR